MSLLSSHLAQIQLGHGYLYLREDTRAPVPQGGHAGTCPSGRTHWHLSLREDRGTCPSVRTCRHLSLRENTLAPDPQAGQRHLSLREDMWVPVPQGGHGYLSLRQDTGICPSKTQAPVPQEGHMGTCPSGRTQVPVTQGRDVGTCPQPTVVKSDLNFQGSNDVQLYNCVWYGIVEFTIF